MYEGKVVFYSFGFSPLINCNHDALRALTFSATHCSDLADIIIIIIIIIRILHYRIEGLILFFKVKGLF